MTDLYWLPKIKEQEFNKILKKKNIKEEDFISLSKHSFDFNQNEIFQRYFNIFLKKKKTKRLKKIKLGIISSSTTNFFLSSFSVAALRYGIKLEIYNSNYNQILQSAFDQVEDFKNIKLDYIFVYIDSKNLEDYVNFNNQKNPNRNIKKFLDLIDTIVTNLNKKTGAEIILTNFAQDTKLIFGSFEKKFSFSKTWFINQLNFKLNQIKHNFLHILDIDILSSTIGLNNWHDDKLWLMGKIPFHLNYVPIFSEYVVRIIANKFGKSKRCLICDLDNTLWGGVIGDDGLDGINIGNGDPISEAHLELQKTILEIKNRGIVLAICSKNNEENALLPFKKHPEMLLKEKDFAIICANWNDKASNIRQISTSLSLGLESMVFLDDNPVERAQVRMELPDVSVPELPNDPSLYSKTLINAGYFETISFSKEDKKRVKSYEANSKRLKLLKTSSNIDKFLKDLQMKISFKDFDKVGRQRITQLINKSNQFNLTTKRYSENNIEKLEKNKTFFTRQIRLKDKYGDNGMICVVICEKKKNKWLIDTWLMSCRVLGRKVEVATLHNLVYNAKKNNIKEIVGKYIPTDRNKLVKNHFKDLGFKLKSKNSNMELWSMNINAYNFKKLPFNTFK